MKRGEVVSDNLSKKFDDIESLPSEDGKTDQWAAINNYDYELFLREQA
jgi:hypothetical protein